VTDHNAHEPLRAEGTRTSRAWVAVSIGVVLLALLITFIAQNNRDVPVHFLGWSGNVSEALALIASAVAGAVLVLAIGLARMIQLRLGRRRHNRAMAKQQRDRKRGYVSTAPSDRESNAVRPED
jgi:uncharacterized integral membrane protein